MARLILKIPYIKGGKNAGSHARYIATRPRVERVGSHGLFGDEDYVDLKKVTAELQICEKNVWTHIISLKREDAARLGYDNARTWRNLLPHNIPFIFKSPRVHYF